MTERAPHLVEDDIAAETTATAELLHLSVGVAEMTKSQVMTEIFADKGLRSLSTEGAPSEDRALRDDEHRLYGAIDGMGGYFGGAIAAETIRTASIEFISEHDGEFTPDNGADRMRDMFRFASTALTERAGDDDKLKEMGAVAAMAHIFTYEDKSYAAVGVVGDARFILKSASEEGVLQSTDECNPPPHANEVWNAFQPNRELHLLQFEVFEIKDGDRLVFLTDGITGDDPEDRLRSGEGRHALSLATPQETADELLRVSKKRKMDDKTAVVVGVHMTATESETEPLSPEASAALARVEVAFGLGDPAPATTPEAEAEPADDEAGEDAPDETPEARAARLEAENVALREREAQHLRRIGELEGQVGELQGQIAALTTRVSELEARLGVRPTPTPTPAEAGARTGTGPVVPGAEAVGAARGEALPATDLAEQIRIRSMAAIDATCNELLERGVNTVYVDKVRLDMRNLMHQNMIDVNREHGRVMRERTAADLENADLRRRLGDGTTAPAPGEAVDPAIADGVRAAEESEAST